MKLPKKLPFISFNSFNTSGKGKFSFGLFIAAVLSIGFALVSIQPGNIGTDGGIFSAIAYKDLQGAQLYVNAWENKPPGIIYLMELFMFLIPHPVYALFVMSMCAALTLGITLYLILYHYFESLLLSLAFIIPGLYFALHPLPLGDGLYTEFYGLLFFCLSYLFHLKYQKNKKFSFLVLSLIFCGIPVWFKEPFIFLIFPFGLYLMIQNRAQFSIWKSMGLLLVPSALVFLLFSMEGSLAAYWDTLLYNFKYSSGEEESVVAFSEKMNRLKDNLILPLWSLFLYLLYLTPRILTLKKNQVQIKMTWILLASCILIGLISPYYFDHYYHPLFAFTFILPAVYYSALKGEGNYKTVFVIVALISMWTIGDTYSPKLKFKIEPYTEDHLVKRLKSEPDASLFVDYVEASSYYIRSEKAHHAFLPVGLWIHFGEHEMGEKNREQIWKDLSENPATYLLTTYTTARFSWSLPDTKFYENHYEKVDSLKREGKLDLYLWKLKNNRADSGEQRLELSRDAP